MLELLTLFILKILDCSLSTVKTIFLIKDKNFLSSLFSTFSTFFYLVMLVHLNKSNSLIAVTVICISNFIGSYIPTLIFDKLEKDSVFVFDVIPDANEKGKEIGDIMRENNIPVKTYKGYNFNKEKVLCCKIFSNTRAESKLIESMLPQDNITCHVTEIRKQVNFNN